MQMTLAMRTCDNRYIDTNDVFFSFDKDLLRIRFVGLSVGWLVCPYAKQGVQNVKISYFDNISSYQENQTTNHNRPVGLKMISKTKKLTW